MSHGWTVRITPEGDIQTLWHDALDLEDLGHCTVARLTNVEYVEDAWEITWASNDSPMVNHRFAKRSDALAMEQQIVFRMLQSDQTPF
jgi:hypothetical protein